MLNPKQTLFVNEYLKSGNATEAYKIAYGTYSEEVAAAGASRLLRNVKVFTEIEKFRNQVMENTKVTIDQLVTELTKIAFSDIRNVVNDKDGLTVRDLSTIDSDTAAAVSEISETDTKFGTIRKVKMHSKLDAIDKLMRHLGGYVTVNEMIDKMTPEQLEELSNRILSKVQSNEER